MPNPVDQPVPRPEEREPRSIEDALIECAQGNWVVGILERDESAVVDVLDWARILRIPELPGVPDESAFPDLSKYHGSLQAYRIIDGEDREDVTVAVLKGDRPAEPGSTIFVRLTTEIGLVWNGRTRAFVGEVAPVPEADIVHWKQSVSEGNRRRLNVELDEIKKARKQQKVRRTSELSGIVFRTEVRQEQLPDSHNKKLFATVTDPQTKRELTLLLRQDGSVKPGAQVRIKAGRVVYMDSDSDVAIGKILRPGQL